MHNPCPFFLRKCPIFLHFETGVNSYGIRGLDAAYTVTYLCVNQEPPCSNPVNTSFTGLYYGILSYNVYPTNAVKIEKSEFTGNFRGIYLGSADYTTVTENAFQVPAWNTIDTCYGLYLGSCTGYHIEGNEFSSPGNTLIQPGPFTPPIRELGIVVDNSGSSPNEIYRNRFDSLDVAINAQRVNRYDDGSAPGGGSGEDGEGGGKSLTDCFLVPMFIGTRKQ